MAISVVNVNSASFERNGTGVAFPPSTHGRRQHQRRTGLWTAKRAGDAIQLPSDAVATAADRQGLARTIFFSYRSLHEILRNAELEEGPDWSSWTPVSRVVSASLARGRHVQLRRPIRLALRHVRPVNVSSGEATVCAFWDFEQTAWSVAGCRRVGGDAHTTLCECDHLTNFAVLAVNGDDGGDGAALAGGSGGSGASSSTSTWLLKIALYAIVAVVALLLALIAYKVSVVRGPSRDRFKLLFSPGKFLGLSPPVHGVQGRVSTD